MFNLHWRNRSARPRLQSLFDKFRPHRRGARLRPTFAQARPLMAEVLEERTMLAAGALDPTFGNGGLVTTDIGMVVESLEAARTVALQPDGKIIVVGSIEEPNRSGFGDFALARYNPDGSLDTSFGGSTGLAGTVRTDLRGSDPESYEVAREVAVQPDGKILAIGESWRVGFNQFRIAMARYNADGTLDMGFGTGGIVIEMFAGYTETRGMGGKLLSNGQIVVTGYIVDRSTGTSRLDMAVARFNSDGSLDTTFGTGGTVLSNTAANDAGNEIEELQDGSLVIAGANFTSGNFALAHLSAGGVLDSGYGAGGIVSIDFGGADAPFDMALQSDGKLVVVGNSAGNSAGNFAIARVNSDGTLDSTFDGDGKTTIDPGGASFGAGGVALDPDGRMVLSGSVQTAAGYDFATVRLNSGGSLDTTFDGDGRAITDFGSPRDFATGVAIQPDGRAVVVGVTNLSATSFIDSARDDFALVRYNLDGSLDTSFDGDGMVVTGFQIERPSFDVGSAVAIQADGKVVVAGSSLQFGTNGDFALARYNPDGSLDASFGIGGKVTTDFGSFFEIAQGVALQADGKIVVAGYSYQGSTGYDFALARYNADGSLNTGFDGDGKVTTDSGSYHDIALGVALQADGKIVVAGYSNPGSTSSDFALARYIGVGPQDFVEAIIPDVQALVTGGALNNGQGTSLSVKLQGVIQLLDGGQETAAANLLQAFVTQLQAFVENGTLTAAEGQPLIDAANAIIDQLNGSPLLAGAVNDGTAPSGELLTEAMFHAALDEAIRLWAQAGADVDALGQVDARIDDLPGARLGVTSANGILWIDRDAAGWGWFVDTTPGESSEFLLPGDQGEQNRMDLLTVVLHELGHLLGFEHEARDGLMGETLSLGTRRAPAAPSTAESLAPTLTLLVPQSNNGIVLGPAPSDAEWAIIARDLGAGPYENVNCGTFGSEFREYEIIVHGDNAGPPSEKANLINIIALKLSRGDDALALELKPGAELGSFSYVTSCSFEGASYDKFLATVVAPREHANAAPAIVAFTGPAANDSLLTAIVDPTPAESSEFLLPGDQGEQNRMDLLTVVLHELGHQLGIEHEADDDLMSESLSPGVRRLPAADHPMTSFIGVFMPPSGASTLQTPMIVSPLPEHSSSPRPLAAASPVAVPLAMTASMQSEFQPRLDMPSRSRIDDHGPFLASEPFWNLDDELLELLAAK